jgi:hypothetical protein
MVDIKSKSVSVLWNMLSVGFLLLARMADLLSHMHFTKRMFIRPDRARVPARLYDDKWFYPLRRNNILVFDDAP